MQQIAARQRSRRQQGLQPELQVAGAGAGAAANDAAALAAADNDTEEEGGGGKEEEEQAAPVPPPPLGDVADTAATIKPPTFAKWDHPTKEPEALRAHVDSFTRQVQRRSRKDAKQ